MKLNSVIRFLILFFALVKNPIAFALPDLSQFQTSLPLKFNTGNPAPNGLPSTQILIQGKVIPIIFDTGAGKNEITLSKHALKGLHVKFTGEKICENAFDGKQCQKIFIIPEMKIGNFTLRNVQGTLMSKLWGGNNKGFHETEASKNGVIGYNLLSQFNVLLDYPHAQAVLYQKGHQPTEYNIANWIGISFSDKLKTTLTLNEKEMHFVWDTGSVPSVIKTSSTETMQTSACPEKFSYGKGKDCKQIFPDSLKTVSGLNLPTTWFLVTNIPPHAPFDGLIGSNFYMDKLVYFDFDHKIIYVKN